MHVKDGSRQYQIMVPTGAKVYDLKKMVSARSSRPFNTFELRSSHCCRHTYSHDLVVDTETAVTVVPVPMLPWEETEEVEDAFRFPVDSLFATSDWVQRAGPPTLGGVDKYFPVPLSIPSYFDTAGDCGTDENCANFGNSGDSGDSRDAVNDENCETDEYGCGAQPIIPEAAWDAVVNRFAEPHGWMEDLPDLVDVDEDGDVDEATAALLPAVDRKYTVEDIAEQEGDIFAYLTIDGFEKLLAPATDVDAEIDEPEFDAVAEDVDSELEDAKLENVVAEDVDSELENAVAEDVDLELENAVAENMVAEDVDSESEDAGVTIYPQRLVNKQWTNTMAKMLEEELDALLTDAIREMEESDCVDAEMETKESDCAENDAVMELESESETEDETESETETESEDEEEEETEDELDTGVSQKLANAKDGEKDDDDVCMRKFLELCDDIETTADEQEYALQLAGEYEVEMDDLMATYEAMRERRDEELLFAEHCRVKGEKLSEKFNLYHRLHDTFQQITEAQELLQKAQAVHVRALQAFCESVSETEDATVALGYTELAGDERVVEEPLVLE